MLRLSICIPTHDGRAEVLDRLLGNLGAQLVDGVQERVEVCVSDNGSRDATQEVLARRRESLPSPLVTYRFERNDGFTPNLVKVVEIASGDFCWLIGSDDLVAPGGVAQVLRLLDEHPDLTGVTLNRYRVNVFDPGTKHFDPDSELPDDPGRLHVYESADAVFANVGLSQDYISTQIFSRELFDEVVREASPDELERSKHFAHLLLLGRMVQRRPRWAWYPEALVEHTTGTSALDEVLGHDYTGFQLAVMEGRDTVWSMLFGRRSPAYKAVMRKAYLRTGRPMAIVGLKLRPNHATAKDVALGVALARHFFWYPRFWAVTAPVLLVPHRVLKAIAANRVAVALARRAAL